MSQFRLARLVLMLAAFGAAPALMHNAIAQNKEDKPAAEQKGPSVRPEIFKLIDPAAVKQLMDAKNYAEVQNRITQAEAIPNRTPYEDYAINRMKLSLGSVSGNNAMAIPALRAVIDSGFLTPDEKDNFVLALGTMYFNAKDWPNAIQWLKHYEKEGKSPDQVRPQLARAYYLAGDYASAKTELQSMTAAAAKSGRAPSEEDLRLLASSAAETKDDAAYAQALDSLLAYYPKDDLWKSAVARGVVRKPGYDAQTNDINVYRLENAAVQKMDEDAYTGLAELALLGGFPTEAKKAVDAGFSKGVLGTGPNAAKQRQLRDRATKGAADDAKNIAGGEASAAKSKNGAGLVNIGWAYVTMEQYDKGIGFIQQGIAKGGLKSPDEAKLRLGLAQLRAGHKDDAIKTFQEIKAKGGPADLAKYWIILANHPTAATGAAK
jgi:tetratricopeptide (TPR) repeat protein